MDIKLPIKPETLAALALVKDHPLAKKIGQQLEATVIGIANEKKDITLKIGGQSVPVQSNQALPLEKGQKLRLIVTKLVPTLEFKVIDNSSQTKTAPATLIQQSPASPVQADAPLQNGVSTNKSATPLNEVLNAKVVAVTSDKIQLQILPDKTSSVSSRQLVEIPIDKNAVHNLKPGQNVILESIKQGHTQEIRILPSIFREIPELIKRYLPKHEAPAVLIDQLIADLPALQNNKNISETLKQLAQEILRSLPKPEQLADSSGFKKAVEQSGLFLEARLGTLAKQTTELQTQDFKGLLLKLIQAFKPELSPQQDQKLTAIELEQLKNLLQKTENSVAKLILDQLASLPKDESPKQVWLLEIPFLDENKAQSVKIEIEHEKQSDSEDGNSPSWSVLVTVTPPNLGTLHCKLSYLDNKINTHFWSEQQHVTDLIKQNLDHLKSRLEAEGLSAGFMDALDGRPQRPKTSLLAEENLLNEKA